MTDVPGPRGLDGDRGPDGVRATDEQWAACQAAIVAAFGRSAATKAARARRLAVVSMVLSLVSIMCAVLVIVAKVTA